MTMSIRDEKHYKDLTERIWHDILNWGNKHMRRYPWRDNPEGYKILIAEILLHRTNANQVKPVYESFIKEFPNFKSITDAGPEAIKSELRSLGLTWRSNLSYAMAKEIIDKYNGNIPLNRSELMQLPGVGPYIASAVLCFGYNLPEPLLDTNTVRVIGRILGIETTDSSRRSKKFENIMKDLISYGEPRRFSLSLIDFAALVCRSAKPRCDLCSLRDICIFHRAFNKNNKYNTL